MEENTAEKDSRSLTEGAALVRCFVRACETNDIELLLDTKRVMKDKIEEGIQKKAGLLTISDIRAGYFAKTLQEELRTGKIEFEVCSGTKGERIYVDYNSKTGRGQIEMPIDSGRSDATNEIMYLNFGRLFGQDSYSDGPFAERLRATFSTANEQLLDNDKLTYK
ncbi:MAG: hypothetical protein M3Q44_01835 [bacterium]|nr:hypothetical protein [bacterium]